MKKKYKNFMEQQNIRAEVDHAFYEKLFATVPRRRTVRRRAIVAAACIAAMIPITVFAAEYIFGTPKVKLGKLDWYDSPNGYSVTFDDLDSFPLDTFDAEMQTITKHTRLYYDSWAEAENALGVNLLNNTFLDNAERIEVRYDGETKAHSSIIYTPQDGQLCYVGATANYRYNKLQLTLKAKLTVEHPTLDEETRKMLLSVEGVVVKPDAVDISYEEYTTKNEIPVTILRKDLDTVISYYAIFAVNDISYELRAWVSPEKENLQKQYLFDALNSFELN